MSQCDVLPILDIAMVKFAHGSMINGYHKSSMVWMDGDPSSIPDQDQTENGV